MLGIILNNESHVLEKIISFIWLLVYFLFLLYGSTMRTWTLLATLSPATNQGPALGKVFVGWSKMLEDHEKIPLLFSLCFILSYHFYAFPQRNFIPTLYSSFPNDSAIWQLWEQNTKFLFWCFIIHRSQLESCLLSATCSLLRV